MKKTLLLLMALFVVSCSATGENSSNGGSGVIDPTPEPQPSLNKPISQELATWFGYWSDPRKWVDMTGTEFVANQQVIRVMEKGTRLETLYALTFNGINPSFGFSAPSQDIRDKFDSSLQSLFVTEDLAGANNHPSFNIFKNDDRDILSFTFGLGTVYFVLTKSEGDIHTFQAISQPKVGTDLEPLNAQLTVTTSQNGFNNASINQSEATMQMFLLNASRSGRSFMILK